MQISLDDQLLFERNGAWAVMIWLQERGAIPRAVYKELHDKIESNELFTGERKHENG